MVTTVDFSLQKGFNIRGVLPLLYVEVNNLFNFMGTTRTSPDYIRWGLLQPQPTDPTYKQYGDVDEMTRFNRGDPRQVFAGLRVTW